MNKVITLGKWEGRGVFVGWHIVHFVCNIFGAQCVQSGILGKKTVLCSGAKDRAGISCCLR